jgi:membrane-bound lytic murein transglycosylase D
MKQLFCVLLVMFGGLTAIAGGTETDPKATDPKSKEGKKDSTAQKTDIETKGFRNLFTSDVFNPAEPYELQINPKAVPYIDDYISKHSNHLESMRVWGKPYFRMMDNILASYGIPREMKYLAVIESNLENSALSWVGARGPWQFMPETARQMGLVVNQTRDDRTDYYKSTHAAARYLKILYNQLGQDWLLVIAGYNGGPGRVLNAIKKTGSRDFWILQKSLPLESRNHVKKFIATHYVMEGTGGITTVTSNELAALHAQAIEENNMAVSRNFGNNMALRSGMSTAHVEGTVTQKIQGKYNSMVLVNTLSFDIAQFNKLNPNFDKLVPEEEGYELRLPEEKMQQFNAVRYQVLQQSIMTSLQSVTESLDGFPDPKKTPAPVNVKKKK